MRSADKKIKLAIVIPNLYKGGAEKVLVNFVNNIDNDKYQPIIFCLKKEGDLLEFVNSNIIIEDLNSPRVYFSIWQIKKYINKHKPDVLIGWMGHINAVLAFYKFMLPANIVLMCRESSIPSQFIKHYRAPGLFRFLYKYLNRYDGIICQSEAMKFDLVNNFNVHDSKIRIINNPIVINGHGYQFSTTTLAFLDSAKKVLLFVGRFSAEKRTSLLTEVMLQLPHDYKLLIIGYGPLEKNIRGEIESKNLEDRVAVITDCSNPSVFYERADCLLLTSAFEGFPNVVLEANAYGCPVCIYQTEGGAAEIINEGNGIYLQPGTSMSEFAVAIKNICTEPTQFDRNATRQRTLDKFGIRQIMDKYSNYILELIKNKLPSANKN